LMGTRVWSKFLGSRNSFIKFPEECSARNVHEVGGKASSLGELYKANAPVPPFFVVTSDGFKEFINFNNLHPLITRLETVRHDEAKMLQLLQDIRLRIMSADFPPILGKEIQVAFQKIINSWQTVAVRSSATLEDASEASFAGQYESFLGIRNTVQLFDAVRKCYASLFNDRAVIYRNRMNRNHTDVHMAIVVQSLVRARSAGVMFTVNPLNGDPSVTVIESSWGLGEAVVKGEVIPDSYVISKVTGEVVKSHSSRNKPVKYEVLHDGTVVKVENPPEATEVSLSNKEAELLAEIGNEMERYFGAPQDIEWVVDKRCKHPDNIFVVQSRPVTVNSTISKRSTQSSLTLMDRILQTLLTGTRV